MEKSLDHLQADRVSGILSYRRKFPRGLVRHIPSKSPGGRGRTEFKVSIRARHLKEPGALDRYQEAERQYLKIVEKARRLATGTYTPLNGPLIEFLAKTYLHNQLALDEAGRWKRPGPEFPYASRSSPEDDYEDSRELLETYDSEGLVAYWGDWTCSYADALGYRVDKGDPQFPRLCEAMAEAGVKLWLALDRRIDGRSTATPPKPEVLDQAEASRQQVTSAATGTTLQALAETLLASKANPVNLPTVGAWGTALRFFREAFGTPELSAISRAMVTEWIELLAQRPARLPKEHRHLPLREVVALYQDRTDVPRLTRKTIRASHLASLSAIWNKGDEAGYPDAAGANPFKARKALKGSPLDEQGTEFEMSELQTIFSLPVFTSGDRPRGGRGEACYWMPLFLLWTGLRPEEAAQLLVSDFSNDEETGVLTVNITADGGHPAKGKRSLKSMARSFPIPSALVDLGLPSYLASLRMTGELALFPELTTKRGYLTPSIGPWWKKYLDQHSVVLAPKEGKQRRPMRDFRPTWATEARTSGLPEEAMSYLMGHTTAGKVQTRKYGGLHPHAHWMEAVRYSKLDLAAIKPWNWRG